jgi:hypothetical protein
MRSTPLVMRLASCCAAAPVAGGSPWSGESVDSQDRKRETP